MSRLAVLTLGAAALTLVAAPAASAATKTVDMGVPLKSQKAFGERLLSDVNDFFPHAVTIHAGDSVKFVPTGFHNVDIPARGKKPLGLLVPGAPVAGSLDAAGAPFWFNGIPSVGFNPAVAVGSLGKKVTYTGAKTIQSGLPLAQRPKPMTVRFTKTGTVTYYCDVHPGMKGTVRVVDDDATVPTAAEDKAALARQVARDLVIARRLRTASVAPNTMTIGNAGAQGVEYFGFLPATLNVPVGTVVKFQMSPRSREVHTATAGPGNPESDPNSYLGKLAASFGAPVIDPAAVYASDPPPAGPPSLSPASHGNGFWSSGALDTTSATPLASSASVRFGTPGTYQLYCLVHPFMRGTVVVA